MKTSIARFLGNKFPYFKGKDKIIRFLHSPDKHIDSGENFTINYFGKKYEGITSNYVDWGVFFKGGLERGLINYIKTVVKEFEYFFDIGANTGSISLPFCGEKNLKIVLFEPLESNFIKLTNNYKINNYYKDHSFHKIALSDTSGTSVIYYSDYDCNPGTATLEKDLEKDHNKSQKIQLERLDNIYKFKNKNILMKIDIQGHEAKLIDGALEFLKNNNILMYLETSDENLLKKLKDMNFKISYPFFQEGKFKFLDKRNSLDVILKNF